jgi:ABC-type multidrug transport system fused ATPase/permease subunit
LFLIFFNFFYIKFIFIFCSECSKKLFLNSLNHGYSYFKKNSSDYFLRKVSNDAINMRVYIVGCIVLMTEILFITCLAGILFYVNSTIFMFVAFFLFFWLI